MSKPELCFSVLLWTRSMAELWQSTVPDGATPLSASRSDL